MASLFTETGSWLKGNLHMHTTRSDGRLAPEKAARLYRDAGYDFIAFTDHWHENEPDDFDGMQILRGCEYNTGDMVHTPVYHIVGVGMETPVELKRGGEYPPQQIIDAVNAAGGLAILAHPAWSVTDPDDCIRLTGIAGVEIYNTFSGPPWNTRADSTYYFDICAARGRMLRCMAADDCHPYDGEEARSFTMVKSRGHTQADILEALRRGDFYASQGPVFEELDLDDGVLTVRCSGAETVLFYSNTVWGGGRVFTGGVTEASYHIPATDHYVRVELIGRDGSRAWSSPFAVNGNTH